MGQSLNDNSESVRNRDPNYWVMTCTDSYFRGTCFEIGANDAFPDLGPDFNNKLSSHWFHNWTV